MHPLFLIRPEEVQGLNDEQARELVARLCRAELGARKISPAFVTWGGDQRAKDGGVDVYVRIQPPHGIAGYVPADGSAFQVKAEKFAPGRIDGEMAPKGKLRPAIVELASVQGAYVICSTRDSLSHSSLSARIKAMEKCLQDHGLAGKLSLDFYDSRKIADWVESHPPITVWVRNVSSRPIVGWKPYSPWAYRETDIEAIFLTDDGARVFVPGDDKGITVVEAIDRMRADISARVPVRVVGLSGVGKTRLAQALFDHRISTGSPVLNSDQAIYTDTSSTSEPTPESMLEALIVSKASAILIVDNCGQALHHKLVELVEKGGRQVGLITIEYDIRDDLEADTSVYRIDGVSAALLSKLLQKRFSYLSDPDVSAIVDFSEGNARVAFALANTAKTTGQLGRLRDDELFKRLFIQRNDSSEVLLQCAKAASLVYSFNSGERGDASEVALLAGIAEVSPSTFRKSMAELKRRGLLQSRGEWRAVLPHAVANRLAAHAMDDLGADELTTAFIEGGSDRLRMSFSRRLGYLHESEVARNLVSKLVSADGPYGSIVALDEHGFQVLRNMAPANPESVLEAFSRGLTPAYVAQLDGYKRDRYGQLLRLIAFDKNLFDRAIELFIGLTGQSSGALFEGSVTDALESLFFVQLSGTEALPSQRVAVIGRLLGSHSSQHKELGRRLLKAALESEYWSSIHEFEFGARKRGYGWAPSSDLEVKAWFSLFVDACSAAGGHDTSDGIQARHILAQAFPGLWARTGALESLESAAKNFSKIDGWPSGWVAVRRTLARYKNDLSLESRSRLEKLEKLLTPRDLLTVIRARVLSTDGLVDEAIDDVEDEINETDAAPEISLAERLERAGAEAEELGQRLAGDRATFLTLVPELVQRSAHGILCRLGRGFGRACDQPLLGLDAIGAHIASLGKEEPSLTFVRGVISAWHARNAAEANAFLEEAANGGLWGRWAPELETALPLGIDSHQRMLRLVKNDVCPLWQFRYLSGGGATATWSIPMIAKLLDAIMAKSDEGIRTGIDILAMVIHGARDRDVDERLALARYCAKVARELDWSILSASQTPMAEHDLKSTVEFALRAGADAAEAMRIVERMKETARINGFGFPLRMGEYLRPFLKIFPLETLDAIYVPDEKGSYLEAERLISADGRTESAISAIPIDALVEWCGRDPGRRCILIASACPLFASRQGDSALTQPVKDFSPSVYAVMKVATDRVAIAKIIMRRCESVSGLNVGSTELEQRAELFDALNIDGSVELSEEIAIGRSRMAGVITWLHEHEVQRQKERAGTFE